MKNINNPKAAPKNNVHDPVSIQIKRQNNIIACAAKVLNPQISQLEKEAHMIAIKSFFGNKTCDDKNNVKNNYPRPRALNPKFFAFNAWKF